MRLLRHQRIGLDRKEYAERRTARTGFHQSPPFLQGKGDRRLRARAPPDRRRCRKRQDRGESPTSNPNTSGRLPQARQERDAERTATDTEKRRQQEARIADQVMGGNAAPCDGKHTACDAVHDWRRRSPFRPPMNRARLVVARAGDEDRDRSPIVPRFTAPAVRKMDGVHVRASVSSRLSPTRMVPAPGWPARPPSHGISPSVFQGTGNRPGDVHDVAGHGRIG